MMHVDMRILIFIGMNSLKIPINFVLFFYAVLASAQVPQKVVQEQRWFEYRDTSPWANGTPVKLEVLASEPANWNGSIIVLNHGSTGRGHGQNGFDDARVKTPVKFVKLGPAFVAKGYRVFVLMRKGRGNSAGKFTEEDARTCAWSDQMRGVEEAEPQLDQFVDWLRAEYKVDKVILVGHSRGGFLSSYYSARHPEKVAYTVNISGGWTTVCEAKNNMTHEMLKDSGSKFKRQSWIYASKDSYFSDRDLTVYEDIAAKAGINFIKLETTAGDGHAYVSANPQLWVNNLDELIRE